MILERDGSRNAAHKNRYDQESCVHDPALVVRRLMATYTMADVRKEDLDSDKKISRVSSGYSLAPGFSLGTCDR